MKPTHSQNARAGRAEDNELGVQRLAPTQRAPAARRPADEAGAARGAPEWRAPARRARYGRFDDIDW